MIEPAIAGYPVAWFSPTYPMLTEIWRDIRLLLLPITSAVDKQQHRIELYGGGVVDMWSLDTPHTARGRKYRRVVVDEAAMVRDLEEAWQAVIRPTLADYRGDAWILSTPKGLNYFHQMFNWGQDPSNEEWASWQMPTAANPFIDTAEIEAMRLSMPSRTFGQEVLAEFNADGGGVFRRVAEACCLSPQTERIAGHRYVMGVDWGKHEDFTVLSVIDTTTKQQAAMERFNHIDYALQMGRLSAMVERFKPTTILAERNSMGEPLIEQLHRQGLPVRAFTTTNASKATIIEGLALALERGDLALLGDPVQRMELQAFDTERLPSGVLRYAAPHGGHDDTVMALALAHEAASGPVLKAY